MRRAKAVPRNKEMCYTIEVKGNEMFPQFVCNASDAGFSLHVRFLTEGYSLHTLLPGHAARYPGGSSGT
jgi:hypothetical protein